MIIEGREFVGAPGTIPARMRAVMKPITLALVLGLVAQADAAAAPDIVIFIADDLGRLDCSPYGARDIRTPHMQRLAEAGLTFERAYVASPGCAPSRAALLTALMPVRNGAEANHSGDARASRRACSMAPRKRRRTSETSITLLSWGPTPTTCQGLRFARPRY